LVILGESAGLLLVSAELNGQPDVFAVTRNSSITLKKIPAMGLKAAETVTLHLNNTPAERLGDDDFSYTAFLDLGNLMWCAMAAGTCEAVKNTAFSTPTGTPPLVSRFHTARALPS